MANWLSNPRDKYAVMTFADIGKELGISGTRAKQIHDVAIRKLRRNLQMKLVAGKAVQKTVWSLSKFREREGR